MTASLELPDLVRSAASIVEAVLPPLPESLQLRLVGIGWATVDHERAMKELLRLHAEDLDGGWRPAERDALLGASAVVRRMTVPRTAVGPHAAVLGEEVAIVVLEPDTEGLLAAVLARRGEGVAAVYVDAAPSDAARTSVRSRPATGPLGVGRLLVGRHRWDPHVVLLESTTTADARPGGTIGG